MAAAQTREDIAEIRVDKFETTSQSKATLMFCHGAWVGGWIWDEFAAWFAEQGFTCLVPTWRGHYDSKPVDDLGTLSVFDFVEDALAVARAKSPDFVIGESMGGLIAQKVAEATPGLKGLALLNSVPPFMVPASPKILIAQFKYFGDLLRNRPNKPTYEDYKELILNNVPEPEAKKFYEKICADSGRALREMSLGKIKVSAASIKCPVYVIAGHLDPILPAKVHRKIAAMYGAQLAEYPTMSHHTFAEEGWQKVATELEHWMSAQI